MKIIQYMKKEDLFSLEISLEIVKRLKSIKEENIVVQLEIDNENFVKVLRVEPLTQEGMRHIMQRDDLYFGKFGE